MHNRRGGAYLSYSCPHRKAWTIGLMALIITILFSVQLGKKTGEKHRIIYCVPDKLPCFSLPDFEDHSGSRILDELVIPYHNFLLEAGENTIEVSLPVIQASYGAEFNSVVVKQLKTLVSNTIYYLERGEPCIVKKVSYEAYLDQDILTILIMTETDDQTLCEPWIFDLTDGGRLIATSELVEELLGLDYATFLYMTEQYIQSNYSQTNYGEAYTVDEQSDLLEDYREIVCENPCDLANALNRTVFPAKGKVYLLYELPQISDDGYSGFQATSKIDEIDAHILRYKEMVTPKEAVLDVVFNSTVHVMGAADQSHALLTRSVFYSSPDVFISAVASVSEADKAYMIESLLRYADGGDCTKMLHICETLKAGEDLSNSESDVLEWIVREVNDER